MVVIWETTFLFGSFGLSGGCLFVLADGMGEKIHTLSQKALIEHSNCFNGRLTRSFFLHYWFLLGRRYKWWDPIGARFVGCSVIWCDTIRSNYISPDIVSHHMVSCHRKTVLEASIFRFHHFKKRVLEKLDANGRLLFFFSGSELKEWNGAKNKILSHSRQPQDGHHFYVGYVGSHNSS